LAALPGWIMLAGGLALIAAAMLVPAWHEAEALRTQRQSLAVALHNHQAANDRLRQLADALDDRDPTLLARVAHDRWRMQPADDQADTLAPPTPDRPLDLLGIDQHAKPAPYQPANTMLNRIATGPHRAALPVVGIVLGAAGIAFPWRLRNDPDDK
ncbi:MAG: hypothetical protein AAF823_16190, partial [Planctomycetota bacterium]